MLSLLRTRAVGVAPVLALPLDTVTTAGLPSSLHAGGTGPRCTCVDPHGRPPSPRCSPRAGAFLPEPDPASPASEQRGLAVCLPSPGEGQPVQRRAKGVHHSDDRSHSTCSDTAAPSRQMWNRVGASLEKSIRRGPGARRKTTPHFKMFPENGCPVSESW